MKSRIGALVLSVCLAVGAGVVHAEATDKQILEMMELTGFGKLIERIPAFARAALKQSEGALEDDIRAELDGAIALAYRGEGIYARVLRSLRDTYKAEPAEGYLRMLRSPLAQKMAGLERAVAAPAAQAELKSYAERLKTAPADPRRLALVKRLDEASRASAFTLDMQTAFFASIFQAIDPRLEPDMRLEAGELQRMVGEVRRSLEGPVSETTIASYLYAYRDVPEAELVRYVEMHESADAAWGVRVLGEAMMVALDEAGREAAKRMRPGG